MPQSPPSIQNDGEVLSLSGIGLVLCIYYRFRRTAEALTATPVGFAHQLQCCARRHNHRTGQSEWSVDFYLR